MRALAPLPPGSPQYQDRYRSPAGVTVAYEEDSGKQHVIEGDGLCPLLYQHLFKDTKGREHTLSTVRLPETVVFDHNFPRAWYFYDAENKAIGKRSSKMLDAQTMFDHFSKSSAVGVSVGSSKHGKRRDGATASTSSAAAMAAPRECDIVAQFFYTTTPVVEEWKDALTRKERAAGRYEGQLLTYVEFFTADTLHDFLFQHARKPDGVLQKFVMPKGEGTSRRNAQLQVTWSPAITTVYKRTNRHRLDDLSVPLSHRASTYDGPRWHSEETMVTDETKSQLASLCKDIAAHFYSTEGKHLTRLGLYFKTDDRNNMWLLWCSCVRVGADSLNPSYLRVPPALDMRTETLNEGSTTVARVEGRRLRQRQLLALDSELFAVSHDLGFALMVNASHKRQAKALDMKGMADEEAEKEGGSGPAFNPQHPLYPSFQCVWTRQDAQNSAQLARPASAGRDAATPVLPPRRPSSAPRSSSLHAPSAQEQVREELVGLAMDAWYAVYSTTLAADPKVMPTRVVTLAAPLPGVLTDEELETLTQNVLRLTRVRGGEAAHEYMVVPYLVASGRRLDRPSAQVEKEVKDFFVDVFAHRGPQITQACVDSFKPYFEDL